MKKGVVVVVVVVVEERKIIRKRKWILILPFVRSAFEQPTETFKRLLKKTKILKIEFHSVAVWPNGLIIFSLFGRMNIWPTRIKNGQSKRQICLNTKKISKKWMTFLPKCQILSNTKKPPKRAKYFIFCQIWSHCSVVSDSLSASFQIENSLFALFIPGTGHSVRIWREIFWHLKRKDTIPVIWRMFTSVSILDHLEFFGNFWGLN